MRSPRFMPVFVSSRRGGVRLALAIVTVLVAFAWYYTQWKPAHDLLKLSGRLDSTLSSVLTQYGLSDRHLLQQKRIAHRLLFTRWIEVERTFSVAKDFPFDRLEKELRRSIKPLGLTLGSSGHLDERYELHVRFRFGMVLQRLVFVRGAGVSKLMPTIQKPQVAIVIDDVSYDLATMDRFAALQVPLTFAILPGSKWSVPLSEKAHAGKFGVILHMPMEPHDLAHNNPGDSALLLSMNRDQLQKQFDRNVASVPDLVGINNHMGSAFTENEEKMRWVMEWSRDRHLIFLDSLTTPKSVVSRIAREQGVAVRSNDVFLDNQDDVAYIRGRLETLRKFAKRHGQAIAIGHYKRKHLVEALESELPLFKQDGIQLVTLPALYRSRVSRPLAGPDRSNFTSIKTLSRHASTVAPRDKK